MNIAGKIFRFLFWINFILIWCWFITLLFGLIFDLEFSKTRYEDIYFGIAVVGIPALIFTYSLKNFTSQGKWYFLFGRVFLALLAFFICLYVIVMASFFNMCAWTTNRILFINKSNSAIQVAERSYGCGATDSTPDIRRTYRIRNLNSFLMIVTEVNVSELKRDDWMVINK